MLSQHCLVLILLLLSCACQARPLTFSRTAVAPAPLSQYFSNFKRVYALQEPAGAYKGSKSVLGETVTIEADFNDPNEMGLAFSGPLTINCSDEPYKLDGVTITLTNMDKSGDCVHDTLQQNQVTLEGITYDAPSDTIEIKAKYLFLDLSIELQHEQTLIVRGDRPNPSPLATTTPATSIMDDDVDEESEPEDPSLLTQMREIFDHYEDSMKDRVNELLSDAVSMIKPKPPKPDPSNHTRPCGTYHGKKKILGHKMEVKISIKSKKTLSIESKGIFKFNCKKEPYSYADRTLNFTEIDEEGSCMHDALSNNSLVLQTVVYHNCSDKLYLFLRHSIIPIMVVLKHENKSLAQLPASNSDSCDNEDDLDEEREHSKLPVIETVKKLAMDVIGKGASTINTLKGAIDTSKSRDHTAEAIGIAERLYLAMKRMPAGTYHGQKTVLGKRFDVRIQVSADSPNLVTISSPSGELQPLLQCTNERIEFGGNRNGMVNVIMDGVSKGGNCVHDALVGCGMVLESFVYDQVSDEFVLVTRIAGVRISVVMPREV